AKARLPHCTCGQPVVSRRAYPPVPFAGGHGYAACTLWREHADQGALLRCTRNGSAARLCPQVGRAALTFTEVPLCAVYVEHVESVRPCGVSLKGLVPLRG